MKPAAKRTMQARRLVRLLSAAPLLLSAGCAVRYVDRDGNLTTLGFTHTTIALRPKDARQEPGRLRMAFGPEDFSEAPFAFRQRSIGLTIEMGPRDGGINLGYQDHLVVIPAADAVTHFSFDSTRPIDARLTIEPLGVLKHAVESE